MGRGGEGTFFGCFFFGVRLDPFRVRKGGVCVVGREGEVEKGNGREEREREGERGERERGGRREGFFLVSSLFFWPHSALVTPFFSGTRFFVVPSFFFFSIAVRFSVGWCALLGSCVFFLGRGGEGEKGVCFLGGAVCLFLGEREGGRRWGGGGEGVGTGCAFVWGSLCVFWNGKRGARVLFLVRKHECFFFWGAHAGSLPSASGDSLSVIFTHHGVHSRVRSTTMCCRCMDT